MSVENVSREVNQEIRFHIEDRPSLAVAIPLAIQHILAAFAGVVAVPLVVGGVLGVPVEDLAFIVSCALFASGIVTFIQSRGVGPVGARMPAVMGTNFGFVGPSIAVGSKLGLGGIYTATIIASLTEIILSRFIPQLRKLFPPIVTGSVVSLIGLTLIAVSIDWAAGGYGAPDYGSLPNLALAFSVMIVVILLNQFGKGMVSASAILLGIVFGYIVAFFMGRLDFTPVAQASWFSFPSPLKYGFHFSLAAILPFIVAYIVSAIESIGDLLALGQASGKELNDDELAAGILCDGVGAGIAGFFNSGATTTFSQNIGVVSLTGVASRFVVMIAGIILILMGLFPKLGALVAIMPNPVLGGAGIIMFGMIAGAGLNIMRKEDLNRRNLLIIAVSFGLGLGVTFRPDFISHLPEALQILFSSGIVTGAIAAVLLNLLLPRDKEYSS
ncbi:nucleobase:cation symporter-2, NCS2 family [Thermosyntropha lipolytica DSM 11003]|uniref:Nucleobase:cation symporter-2, NCS2 family n=1 Tax=Thermosyntropha lipolytica DSM 11003 TaxID=1123382 RepID=A0A1M5QDG9_9FIRM|nr:nucleobase:cation symporter-2 family protein [Thermosyntropha lipolytica]SHH12092.1 nucleobase:cation symporter-2, NCS2 family [Thermosyntropha lipolytica DSM 11003]